jgi:polyphosphate kinase 2 (PPK2 family)
MAFCDEEQHQRFLDLRPEIKKHVVDGGIRLIKTWLEVGQDEQERRFGAEELWTVQRMMAQLSGDELLEARWAEP